MPIMVNVLEAKTRLSELLKLVEAGEEVVIARAGTPIATPRPYHRPSMRLGTMSWLPPVSDDVWFDHTPPDDPSEWEGDLDEFI